MWKSNRMAEANAVRTNAAWTKAQSSESLKVTRLEIEQHEKDARKTH
jgi:hypothetical protein